MCCSGNVEIRQNLLPPGDRLDQLVGHVQRIQVHQPDPVEALDLVQAAEQFGQPGPAVGVHAVERRVLGHEDQLPHAVGRQLLGLGRHLLDRLAGIRAAHPRNRTESARPVAALGDLQIGHVRQRDPQPAPVRQGRTGRRTEKGDWSHLPERPEGCCAQMGPVPLFLATIVLPAIGGAALRLTHPTRTSCVAVFQLPDGGDNFIPGENANYSIQPGKPLEQPLPVALGETAGHDHPPQPPRLLQPQHLFDRLVRFRPGVVDESAGVDQRQVGAVGFGDQAVALSMQQAGHPLAIDQVFRATEANQGKSAWGVFLLFVQVIYVRGDISIL